MSEEVPGSPQFPLPDTVSQAVLRELLQKVLPTPSDLEQFCVDYFPAVTATFYVGMDRSQVTTKLLSAGPDVVWQQLKLVRAAALTLINIAAMEQAVARVGMHSELPAPAGRLVLVGMLVLGSAGLLGLLVRHTNQQLPVAFDLSHPLPILQNRFRDGGEGSARPDAAAPDAAASPSNHLLNMQSSSEGVYQLVFDRVVVPKPAVYRLGGGLFIPTAGMRSRGVLLLAAGEPVPEATPELFSEVELRHLLIEFLHANKESLLWKARELLGHDQAAQRVVTDVLLTHLNHRQNELRVQANHTTGSVMCQSLTELLECLRRLERLDPGKGTWRLQQPIVQQRLSEHCQADHRRTR